MYVCISSTKCRFYGNVNESLDHILGQGIGIVEAKQYPEVCQINRLKGNIMGIPYKVRGE